MMKNYILVFFTACMLLTFTACETLPPVTDGSGDEGSSDGGTTPGGDEDDFDQKIKDLMAELCDNGTLNCISEPPPGSGSDEVVNNYYTTVVENNNLTPIDAYKACMEDCNEAGETDGDSCEAVCHVVMDSGVDLGFESDAYGIPANPKVLFVNVRSCIDTGVSAFHFKGTNIGTRKFHNNFYAARGLVLPLLGLGGLFTNNPVTNKSVYLPHQVGEHPDCKELEGLDGTVQLEFVPKKDTEAVYIGESNQIEIKGVVPFSDDVDSVTVKWKGPSMTTATIPSVFYKDDLDLSQITWIVDKMITPMEVELFNLEVLEAELWAPSINKYTRAVGYAENGGGYGDTILKINNNKGKAQQAAKEFFRSNKPMEMEFTVMLLISSKG